MTNTFSTDLQFARERDAADPLGALRDQFVIPAGPDGTPAAYFCGNSLGLMPVTAEARMAEELKAWADLAVHAHLDAKRPWYTYHEWFREPLGRLLGAQNHEVVVMNSLTVNLHLLMVSFFRPTRERYRILMEAPAFPSDMYAVQTQLRHHGLDPAQALIEVGPRDGETWVREEDVEAALGPDVALVLMGGVNFLTGQCFDMKRITAAGHAAGAMVGFDLAHAAGNVDLHLHDWDVDFAAWCSYKYLNGGAGATAGAFIHERHGRDTAMPRFGGWWGNDPQTRFRMHLEREFQPRPSADGWQLSNPSVLAMAPLGASLGIFNQTSMEALRRKSVDLTGYLEYLLRSLASDRVRITTPSDAHRRGCQLSLVLTEGARRTEQLLKEQGMVADFREPDILRVAPTPLYNRYQDAWRLAQVLAGADQ